LVILRIFRGREKIIIHFYNVICKTKLICLLQLLGIMVL